MGSGWGRGCLSTSVVNLVPKHIKKLQENPGSTPTYSMYGFAWVDNLGSNVEREGEGEAVGRDGGGRTIPSTIYTRTLECPEGPANLAQTETRCQHGTWDTVNLQGIHSENENITLSSSDVSPMLTKPIKKVNTKCKKKTPHGRKTSQRWQNGLLVWVTGRYWYG
uniref:Uncharacterized protein n=1 Tax=Tanacetum cinerariifolium TaxID=118510 RepID=A0A699JVC4_TANCI|nr:hypothetical protein [Tanacetum cinerariifolium]